MKGKIYRFLFLVFSVAKDLQLLNYYLEIQFSLSHLNLTDFLGKITYAPKTWF
jgi:hypothetical protein